MAPMTEQMALDRYTPTGLSTGQCWLWTGAVLKRSGYGQVNLRNRHWLAHRLAYYVATGDLPEQVHHRCGTKLCVNPAHLIGMSLQEHQHEHHVKTECIRGHDLTDPANCYTRPDTGQRLCRPCFAARARERRANMTVAERQDLDRERTVRRRRQRAREAGDNE